MRNVVGLILLLVCGVTSVVTFIQRPRPAQEAKMHRAAPRSNNANTKPPEPTFAKVRVFYATDRSSSGKQGTLAAYASTWSKSLSYGIADVSIPRDHRLGNVESPSIWRLEFRKDPEKHIVLLSASELQKSDFASQLSMAVGGSANHEILLFVHGFNVSFESAIERTAQIFYDLELAGVPVTYAWPSQGELGPIAYVADGNMSDVTAPHLKTFLLQLAQDSKAQRIYVVAHSMGNKVLARALDSIVADSSVTPKPRFSHIALTAPDLDERTMEDIAARICSLAGRITLYASDNDEALLVAGKYTKSRRAGQGGSNILVLPNIDTIDASAVDTSFIGHFYYGSNLSVLSALFYLFRDRPPNERFLLLPAQNLHGKYWKFRKAS